MPYCIPQASNETLISCLWLICCQDRTRKTNAELWVGVSELCCTLRGMMSFVVDLVDWGMNSNGIWQNAPDIVELGVTGEDGEDGDEWGLKAGGHCWEECHAPCNRWISARFRTNSESEFEVSLESCTSTNSPDYTVTLWERAQRTWVRCTVWLIGFPLANHTGKRYRHSG